MKITLLCTLHDPDGHLLVIDPNPLELFHKTVIVKTDETGVHNAYFDIVYSLPKTGMADGRRNVLRTGLEDTDSDYFFYVDYDRLVFWLNHYPDELWKLVQNITIQDFAIYGRTRSALLSHPPIQRLTEIAGNEIFNNHFRTTNIDVLAGTRSLSRQCAKYIIEQSKAQGAGIDVEWCLLAHGGGFTIRYYHVNGLAWEGNGNRSERDEVKLRINNLQDIYNIIYDKLT